VEIKCLCTCEIPPETRDVSLYRICTGLCISNDVYPVSSVSSPIETNRSIISIIINYSLPGLCYVLPVSV
jgi:hypothetical protein